jgi:hypothetical protein
MGPFGAQGKFFAQASRNQPIVTATPPESRPKPLGLRMFLSETGFAFGNMRHGSIMPLYVLPYPVIDPVMVHLGPLPIRWYALSYIVSLVVG